MKKMIIKCSVCQKKIGEIQKPEIKPEDIQMLKDSCRCDDASHQEVDVIQG